MDFTQSFALAVFTLPILYKPMNLSDRKLSKLTLPQIRRSNRQIRILKFRCRIWGRCPTDRGGHSPIFLTISYLISAIVQFSFNAADSIAKSLEQIMLSISRSV